MNIKSGMGDWYFTTLTVTLLHYSNFLEQCASLSTGLRTIFLQIRPLCWPHEWRSHECGQHSGRICKKIVQKPVESDKHCSKKLLQCSNVTVSVVGYFLEFVRRLSIYLS